MTLIQTSRSGYSTRTTKGKLPEGRFRSGSTTHAPESVHTGFQARHSKSRDYRVTTHHLAPSLAAIQIQRKAITWASRGSRRRDWRLPASTEIHRVLVPHRGCA